MPRKKSSLIWQKQLPIFALGALAIVSSFAVGIRTAGDIETVAPSEAGGIRISGDVDNDGRLTVRDAIEILEVSQGYEEATPVQLLADPNADGRLTADDAMRVLQDLASL